MYALPDFMTVPIISQLRIIRSAFLNRAVERNMHKINPSFKVGSSIRVKEGIKDPDSDMALSGWQGRILEIGKDESGHPQLLVHGIAKRSEACLNPTWNKVN
jgi:hypothetical protein